MYGKLLTLVDKDSHESRRKTKLNIPRMAMLQGESNGRGMISFKNKLCGVSLCVSYDYILDLQFTL